MPLLTIEWSLLLRTPQQGLPMLFNGRDNLRKMVVPTEESSPPFTNIRLLWSTHVSPNRYHDRFSRFSRAYERVQQTDRQTDRHTDRSRYSNCSNRPYLAITVKKPNNTKIVRCLQPHKLSSKCNGLVYITTELYSTNFRTVELTPVWITLLVVLIITATVTYSLEHGLHKATHLVQCLGLLILPLSCQSVGC